MDNWMPVVVVVVEWVAWVAWVERCMDVHLKKHSKVPLVGKLAWELGEDNRHSALGT
jgi:hypothetical protein